MRKKMVAANWKMNLLQFDALTFLNSISKNDLPESSMLDIIILPSSIFMQKMIDHGANRIHIGAQNFYFKEHGAYTGEVSLDQLKSINCSYVLIGHSERRTYFSETPALILNKLKAAVEKGFNIILCIGESINIRESGDHLSYLQRQLEESLGKLKEQEVEFITIAYEPIWAIGTGLTASVDQVNEVHNFIRTYLIDSFPNLGDSLRILYGGSCNEQNAKELFSCPNVDGGLIGGASLDSDKFLQIIQAAHEVSRIEH
jgi:triosephosphate isomerase